MINIVVQVQGEKNAALAALTCLKSLANEVDEESFYNVAESVPNHDGPGFIVASYGDLYRLCDIGNFHIFYDKGVIKARLNNNTPCLLESD